jgi:hypothetical protein
MTWDMKLGLLVGVGLVVAAALVFYKPEGAGLRAGETAAKAQIQSQNGYRTVQLSPMPQQPRK